MGGSLLPGLPGATIAESHPAGATHYEHIGLSGRTLNAEDSKIAMARFLNELFPNA